MTPVDVRDLYAFLRSLPAVTGRAPPHALNFPFSFRRAVGPVEAALHLEPSAFADAPGRDAGVEARALSRRGAGTLRGMPFAAQFSRRRSSRRRLTGGPLPDGKGKAPDITAEGLKDWSKADIAEALSSGLTPSGNSLGGPMAAVVRNTAELPPTYRESIARYLKSLGPEGGPRGG